MAEATGTKTNKQDKKGKKGGRKGRRLLLDRFEVGKLLGVGTFAKVYVARNVQNLVLVSTPELAREVLHVQGVEFGSRTRNVVLDIFTDKGQDMVFTVYGDHWRKMRPIMTVPFFTNKVVQQNQEGWEEEAQLVVEELKRNPKVKAINFERSRLSQSFEYNYGEFILVLRPFLRKYLNKRKEVKDRRLHLFYEHFVVRGTLETTLWSIEWGIAELVNNPVIQRKLRVELDAVLGRDQLAEPDLQRLPYLNAVVKETLRYRMAIPLLVPHMNVHDANLAGFDIPT
ncbi:trans-cinnamate 4-monooxygenase [Canna indica]|uniref:Trans-cinnamate 4-monooxygenase n=1 Tax=Canna indica TaxID=4628 RepID=A0AAQ3KUJ8_9LILI|nr:trans-cinnamate 4-monooxygenase [Canna indica]